MTLYRIPVRTLAGDPTTLAGHEDRALLIVNVASNCGYTPQYEGLERLFRTFSERGLTVLGFPCNQFAGEEPGTAAEIGRFCSRTYGVTFPMFEKIEVKGPGRHPLYGQLVRYPDDEGVAGDVEWNFEKFLVAPRAASVRRFRPDIEPEDPRLLEAIDLALAGR